MHSKGSLPFAVGHVVDAAVQGAQRRGRRLYVLVGEDEDREGQVACLRREGANLQFAAGGGSRGGISVLARPGQQVRGQAVGGLVDTHPAHEREALHPPAGCAVHPGDEGKIGDVVVQAGAGLEHGLLPLCLNGALELQQVVPDLVGGVIVQAQRRLHRGPGCHVQGIESEGSQADQGWWLSSSWLGIHCD